MVKLDIITGFEPVVPGSNPGEGTKEKYMKKIFLSIAAFCLLLIIFIPVLAAADAPLVPCNGTTTPCTMDMVFTMIGGVYSFIIKLAAGLATLVATIGGVLILVSAGNPSLSGTGKKIFYSALIGLFLVLGSWLIINLVLTAIGYKNVASWSTL